MELPRIPDEVLRVFAKEAIRIEKCKGAYDQVLPALEAAWLDGRIAGRAEGDKTNTR